MSYRVVSSTSITELERLVNSAIKIGYRPIGGITVCHDVFYQSMEYISNAETNHVP